MNRRNQRLAVKTNERKGAPKKSKSILLRVIQRIVQFEKGSVNILMEKDEKSCEVELSSMSTQSCEKRGERRAYYRAV